MVEREGRDKGKGTILTLTIPTSKHKRPYNWRNVYLRTGEVDGSSMYDLQAGKGCCVGRKYRASSPRRLPGPADASGEGCLQMTRRCPVFVGISRLKTLTRNGHRNARNCSETLDQLHGSLWDFYRCYCGTFTVRKKLIKRDYLLIGRILRIRTDLFL